MLRWSECQPTRYTCLCPSSNDTLSLLWTRTGRRGYRQEWRHPVVGSEYLTWSPQHAYTASFLKCGPPSGPSARICNIVAYNIVIYALLSMDFAPGVAQRPIEVCASLVAQT